MLEGALKSSSDWAGQMAHEAESLQGTIDLLRQLQQVERLFWYRGVARAAVLTMKMRLEKIAPFLSWTLKPLKFNASASSLRLT